jgi:1,4-alpha-glucan branching enzyme
VYRLIMRGAHRIVACSEALARKTIEVFPDARPKVTYVHNGIDLARYAEAPGTCAQPRPFLLCVCRQVRKKGVDTLLRAFALVLCDLPDMSLVLVGGGPLLEEHRALARTLQIEQQVVFSGDMAHGDVIPLFAACTLFVLPSRAEPFGIVLLEAAYYRKGIVCTRVGGVPEIIVDGFNGVLVVPDDPASMATQIVALVRDPESAELLGARAHQTVMTRFLWRDRIHDYIAIYEGGPGAAVLGLGPGLA